MAPPKKKPAAKKPAAARAAAKAPAKAKAPARAKASAKPKGEVTVAVTPPELAPGTDAARFDLSVKSPKTRPSAVELGKAPWLAQDRAYRVGYYLLTHGLSAYGHHELELCNVPGTMLRASVDLLNHLASYVVEDGGKLGHGEVMLVDESPLSVVGFQRIAPGRAGTEHEAEVLRVVFLR